MKLLILAAGVILLTLATGCPKLPQGNTRSDRGNEDGGRTQTPAPATAPNSRAEQAGGTANRAENFGDISNPNSPVKAPGAEKTKPAPERPAAKSDSK